MIKILFSFCIVATLSSCTFFKSPSSKHELKQGTTYWLDYDSSRSSAIYSPSGGNIKYCLAPPPDVATTIVSSLKAEMTTKEIQKISGDANFSTAVVDLARRTTTINFIRDTLYRVCEARLQGPLNADEKEIFMAAINAAVNITEAEKDKQKKELTDAAIKGGADTQVINNILGK